MSKSMNCDRAISILFQTTGEYFDVGSTLSYIIVPDAPESSCHQCRCVDNYAAGCLGANNFPTTNDASKS